jgi:hypothetical protein
LVYDPKSTQYDGDKVVYERDWVLAANAYKAYREFCSDGGFTAKHQNNFCPSLVNLLVDKLEKDVSSRKTKTGKVIDGLRLRQVTDPIGDDGDGFSIFSQISEKNDPVTTVTTNLDFSINSDPKPPTVDRTIPETTKFNADVEYLIVDGEVKWLEIFFHKHATAKEWKKLATLWGCQTSDLEMRRHNGNKWLLIVKGLTIARLEQILSQNLTQPPQQPSRR